MKGCGPAYGPLLMEELRQQHPEPRGQQMQKFRGEKGLCEYLEGKGAGCGYWESSRRGEVGYVECEWMLSKC